MSPIHAVGFDARAVLINETREYGTWADWLGIPRDTFSVEVSVHLVMLSGQGTKRGAQPDG